MPPQHILIVDDDPHIQELLYVNLSAAGYDVARAADGREAVRRVAERRPDLVILDVTMPEMDGWELCKTLKDDSELEDLRIVMLTAKDSARDKMIGRDIFRVDAYLTKPFDVAELLTRVRGLLDA